jgi:undecaprenyl-diphosphatase
MTLLQSILLGIIQGLTEFLPISSSAHLVIMPYLFGWKFSSDEAFMFDVLVQVASLIAVLAFFSYDLIAIFRAFFQGLLHKEPFRDSQARLGWYLILATIPAGMIGLYIKDLVERAFASPIAAAAFLFLNAIVLTIAERAGKRTRSMESLSWKDALWVGCAQALAIFPGISRSGATISGGMLRNLERPSATRFAMLMSIPIMLSAGFLTGIDLLRNPHLTSLLKVFVPGFLASAITGYLSIRWLLRYLASHTLYVFSIYCTFIALFVLGIVVLGN